MSRKPFRSRPSGLNLKQLECREVPAAPIGIGTGLVANYFADADLAALAATSAGATVNADWGAGSPAAGVPADGFSARWTGKVQAQFSEPYTFSVAADEGVRLWVGGRLLVDSWAARSPGEWGGTATLKSGETADVKLEYSDRAGGPARVRFNWTSPSTLKQVVPASQLYASAGWLDTGLGGATPGSFAGTAGGYTVRGSGRLGGTADGGHFAYQPLAGDGTVVARLDPVSAGTAGLMVRASADPAAPFAAVGLSPGGAVRFVSRAASGATATEAVTAGADGPVWLKLVRNGSLVSGYTSATAADGSWRLAGSTALTLGRSALAGLTAASGQVDPVAARFSGVAVAATVPVGANLDGVTDWSLASPFVDLMKQARGFDALTHAGAATTDAGGWPTEDARVIVLTGFTNTARVYNGTYKLSFTGRADVGTWVTPGTLSNLRYDPATNRTTADITVAASNSTDVWYFGLDFRNTQGGVKDIRLIRPGHDAANPPTFTPQFLATVAPFSTLRFMDWGRTNDNPVVNWADRAKPTDATQATARGVAWEHMVQLANQTGKDLWVNVPAGATDDYVRSLAALIKGSLNPDRAVYVEYSNEVWNGIFGQTTLNREAAVAEVEAGMRSGSPSNLFNPGETVRRADGSWAYEWEWAFRRVARRGVEISNGFAQVWGAEAINTRVRPVLASQTSNPYVLKTQLEFIDAKLGDPRRFLYAAAGAPYFYVGAADRRTDLSADEVLAALAADVATNKPFLAEFAHLATYYGLENLAYEGGPDTFGPNNIQAKKAASLDPRMKDLIAGYLSDWYAQGGGLFNWFVAGPTNYDTQYGTWGLTNDLLDLQAPKAQGVEAVRLGPKVLPTVGAAVSAEVLARDAAGQPPTTDPYPRYLKTGDARDYLVRSPVAGAYHLRVRYAAVAAGGQLQVLVNDRPVQTLTLPATGPGYDPQWAPNDFADSVPLTINLDEGLNVVRLRVVAEGYTLYSLKFDAPSGTVPPPPPGNTAPSVSAAAAAGTVTGTTVGLTAAGTDDGGEPALSYAWAAVAAPAGGAASFTATGTNAAKATTASFTRAGTYTLRVTATDAGGLTAAADVVVTVSQTLTRLTVAPGTVTLVAGGTQAFTAAGTDQFAQPMALPAVVWSVAGGGSVTAGGLYTAPGQPAPATVTAAAGGVSGSAVVTVTGPGPAAPTIDYAAGFPSAAGLALNGTAGVTGGRLRLTRAGSRWAAGSAWATAPVAADRFSTRFTFQLGGAASAGLGDGLAFVIQRQGPAALGGGGEGVGNWGIGWSAAVTFNLGDAGTGAGTVTLTTGGAKPGGPGGLDLAGSGVSLRGGNPLAAALDYDQGTLRLILTDTVTGAAATRGWAVNIPVAINAPAAYVGFTAGTGDRTADADVLNWTFGPAAAAGSPPTIATPASAAPATVTGTTAQLGVLGADDAGEAGLVYTWAVATAPAGAPPVTFAANGTNAAKATVATFGAAGAYTFRVTVRDAQGQTATSGVAVTVAQTPTTVRVTPAAATVAAGGTLQLTAAGTDQFGAAMTLPAVTWAATAGAVNPAGLFTAPARSGSVTVTAAAGGVSGSAVVTVTGPAPTIDYAAGFPSAGGLALNGTAGVTGGRLRLTRAGSPWAAGSAWVAGPAAPTRFSTRFTFQLGGAAGPALGGGLAFVVQGQGSTALGGGGEGVGVWGVGWSVAVAFNLGNNGPGTVTLTTGGARPGGPGGLDLSGTGVSLRGGNPLAAALDYTGTTLRLTLTDTVTGATASTSWAIDIPAALNGRAAHVGFTAGTGDRTADADLLNWTYTAG